MNWVRDAGIDPTEIDWDPVDRAHDEYLDQVLKDRVRARERITVLYQPVDQKQDPTWEQQAKIAKASMAINREFAAQLAAEDFAFLNSIATARGLDYKIVGYLQVRRQLDRIAKVFEFTPSIGLTTSQFARPVERVLGQWPTEIPRDSAAIIQWVTTCAPTLAIEATKFWEACQWEVVETAEANVLPRGQAITPEIQKSIDRSIKKVHEKTKTIGVEYLRRSLEALDATPAGIPPIALEKAREQILDSILAVPDGVRETARAFKAARETEGLPEPIRQSVHDLEREWRANQYRLLRRLSPGTTDQDKAAHAAFVRLVATMPSPELKARIEKAYNTEPPPMELPAPTEPEDLAFYSDAQEYKGWTSLGLIRAAPTRASLEAVAELAQLPAEHRTTFVSDSLQDWQEFLSTQSALLKASQDRLEVMGRKEDPAQFDAMISIVTNECVGATNRNAADLDDRIRQRLVALTESFEGKAEPAATIWRVLRAYPCVTESMRSPGLRDLTPLSQAAFASAAVLALDQSLMPATRTVVTDLLVARADELLAAAEALEIARREAIGPIGRALLFMRNDPVRAQEKMNSAVATFQSVCNHFDALQQEIVDEAAQLIGGTQGDALRLRRAQLRYPGVLGFAATPFVRDGLHAIALSGKAFESDPEFRRKLELDSIALAHAVWEHGARNPSMRFTDGELADLYRLDEELAELSLRRLDWAVRSSTRFMMKR